MEHAQWVAPLDIEHVQGVFHLGELGGIFFFLTAYLQFLLPWSWSTQELTAKWQSIELSGY